MLTLVAALCGALLALGFTGAVGWPWIIFILVLLTIAVAFRRRRPVP